MIKKIFAPTLLILLLSACTSDNSFSIENDKVGPLTKTSKVSDLASLFTKDSLVDSKSASEYTSRSTGITIFEKGGKKLLRILPKTAADSSTVENIQVFDERYVTSKGIHLKSTYKDISSSYTIKRIDNLLDAVVVFVNESDVYFTIDKKYLPGELMFDTSKRIEKTQIPDDAPIKYLMIGW